MGMDDSGSKRSDDSTRFSFHLALRSFEPNEESLGARLHSRRSGGDIGSIVIPSWLNGGSRNVHAARLLLQLIIEGNGYQLSKLSSGRSFPFSRSLCVLTRRVTPGLPKCAYILLTSKRTI